GRGGLGRDSVEIQTEDDEQTIREVHDRFGLDAQIAEGSVRVYVPHGDEFVPRLFAELHVPVRSVNVAHPTLDDVFMSYTGRTIRDAEATASDRLAAAPWRRRVRR